MKNHRPLVALDLDGTLISCREKQVYALRNSLSVYEVEYSDFERFWSLKREGATTVQALLRTGVDEEKAVRVAKHWVDTVESRDSVQQDVVLPSVHEALLSLMKIADLMVLSARRDPDLFEWQLHSLGLAGYLKHYETVSPGRNASHLKSARLLHHGACCYVGDTESDLAAAIEANVPVYLVSTGQRTKQFLDQIAALSALAPSFETFAEALERVKNELLS